MFEKLTFFKLIIEQYTSLRNKFDHSKEQFFIRMRNLQNDTDLLLDENTEMMSVLNDLGELEDLTELYGDKNDII